MKYSRIAGAAITAVIASLFVATAAPTVAATCPATPKFSGTFVQPDLIDNWSNAQLDDEFGILDDACIDTQILQWTADSKAGTTIYNTALPGLTQNSTTDVVDRLLAGADVWNKSVIVGLQVNPDWFSVAASNAGWLTTEANFAKDLADELYGAYGSYDSFDGWYLPFEMDNLGFPTSTEWDRMGAFYADVIDHLHTLSPGLPVAVAPFYNDGLAGAQTPAQWGTMWQSILGDADIDIIALQDGVGAGHATVADLPDWFAATRTAINTARPSTLLYSDAETFTFGPSGLQPMPVGGFVADMEAVESYVDGYWAFAYDHYQSPQSAVSPFHHATYLNYLATGVVETSAPAVPTSVSATASGSQTITLAWTAPSDNVGVAGYLISRGGSLVAIKHGSTGFVDRQLDGSTTYSYTIRAFDAAGNLSASTSAVTATTGAAPSYANNWSLGRSYTSTVAASGSYPDTGGVELTNGVRGAVAYGAAWQGRNALGSYSFTVDLGSNRSIGSVETGWLQVRGDYVFLPPSVSIATSIDGINFTNRGTITIPAVTDVNQVKSYRLLGIATTARYVQVTVDGGSAWTMLDEIEVRG